MEETTHSAANMVSEIEQQELVDNLRNKVTLNHNQILSKYSMMVGIMHNTMDGLKEVLSDNLHDDDSLIDSFFLSSRIVHLGELFSDTEQLLDEKKNIIIEGVEAQKALEAIQELKAALDKEQLKTKQVPTEFVNEQPTV